MLRAKKTSDSKSDLKGARPASTQRPPTTAAFRTTAASHERGAGLGHRRPAAERQAAA